MAEFKPMVKMETTEPSVELKLKKGGTVGHKKMKKGGTCAETGHKMMDGGMAPTIGTPTGGLAPAMAPKRPALSLRRRAMAPRAPMAAPATPVMKKGGKTVKKATGGVVKGQGGYATGGVVKGQGGYKKGGKVKCADGGNVIKSTTGETKVDTVSPNKSPAKTGGVKLGNGGGYKKGGKTKKAYASGGSVNDSGKATSMAQGRKTPSSPVSISRLSGTFKKGGNVKKKADGGSLRKVFDEENAPAMKASKADSNLKYGPYNKKAGGKIKKMADGGLSGVLGNQIPVDQPVNPIMMPGGNPNFGGMGRPYGNPFMGLIGRGMGRGIGFGNRPQSPIAYPGGNPNFGNTMTPANNMLMAKKGGKVKKFDGGGLADVSDAQMRQRMAQGVNQTYADETASNEALAKSMRDALMYLPRQAKALYDKAKGAGSVTDTKTTVSRTVSPPAQKRGGKVKK